MSSNRHFIATMNAIPRRCGGIVAGAFAAGALLAAAAPAQAETTAGDDAPAVDNGAVVLMYHRFGDEAHPSTNIRMDQFEAHLEELRKPRYSVLPLDEIVSALLDGEPLPERAVAITVDDAYATFYEHGWPALEEAGLPVTLFVATEPVDQGQEGIMTWDQMREVAESDLVTIANHSHTHRSMAEQSPRENREELRISQERLRAELGLQPNIFAYPFGEYSLEVQQVVEEAGFEVAFGQQSGAIGRVGDRFALPRFALNETYGEMERFQLAADALALPVTDVTPKDRMLTPENNPPMYGFTVHGDIAGAGRINCFAGGRGKVATETISNQRVEVRLETPFAAGRARINCTMPGPDGRWRWFGTQFYVTGE